MLIRLATIITRDIGAAGRPPVIRPFFVDEAGDKWAVPRDDERRALARVGTTVDIEIRCLDDQFAYPRWSSCQIAEAAGVYLMDADMRTR